MGQGYLSDDLVVRIPIAVISSFLFSCASNLYKNELLGESVLEVGQSCKDIRNTNPCFDEQGLHNSEMAS